MISFPLDILKEIFSYTDVPTNLSLYWVCKDFRGAVTLPEIKNVLGLAADTTTTDIYDWLKTYFKLTKKCCIMIGKSRNLRLLTKLGFARQEILCGVAARGDAEMFFANYPWKINDKLRSDFIKCAIEGKNLKIVEKVFQDSGAGPIVYKDLILKTGSYELIKWFLDNTVTKPHNSMSFVIHDIELVKLINSKIVKYQLYESVELIKTCSREIFDVVCDKLDYESLTCFITELEDKDFQIYVLEKVHNKIVRYTYDRYNILRIVNKKALYLDPSLDDYLNQCVATGDIKLVKAARNRGFNKETLNVAARYSNVEITEFLLQEGCICSNSYPFESALQNNNSTVAELFYQNNGKFPKSIDINHIYLGAIKYAVDKGIKITKYSQLKAVKAGNLEFFQLIGVKFLSKQIIVFACRHKQEAILLWYLDNVKEITPNSRAAIAKHYPQYLNRI